MLTRNLDPKEISIGCGGLRGFENREYAAGKLRKKSRVRVRRYAAQLTSVVVALWDQRLRPRYDADEFATGEKAHDIDHVHAEIPERAETCNRRVIAPRPTCARYAEEALQVGDTYPLKLPKFAVAD